MKQLIAILFLINLFQLSTSHAESDVSVCYGAWPPYSYIDENGTSTGIVVDLINIAVSKLGKTVNWTQLPYRRCIQQVKQGKMDAIALLNEQTEGITTNEQAVAYWVLGAVVRENDKLKAYSSLNDFTGKKWLKVTDFDYPQHIEEFSDWQTIPVHELANTLSMLEVERGDIAIEDVPFTLYQLQNVGHKVRILYPSIASIPQYFGVHRSAEPILKTLSVELAKLRADGIFDQIYEKYLGMGYSQFLEQNNIIK